LVVPPRRAFGLLQFGELIVELIDATLGDADVLTCMGRFSLEVSLGLPFFEVVSFHGERLSRARLTIGKYRPMITLPHLTTKSTSMTLVTKLCRPSP
jgi:hypothetical protein